MSAPPVQCVDLPRRQGLSAPSAIGALALAGCAVGPAALRIDTRHTAQGQDSRAMFLVLHYTVGNFPSSLHVLTRGPVSSHYLVSDETPPKVYRLVDENRRAWHAGVSHWKGHSMLNAASIGIEIVHPGVIELPQGRFYPPFEPAQMDLVVALVQDIVRRHGIRPDRVLGHSDVSPQNKIDPGPRFPWKRLADLGLVLWPDAERVAALRPQYELELPELAWFQTALRTHGFDVPQHGLMDEPTRRVIAAFQMKYRPARFDGQPDAETAALLQVLIEPSDRARAP
jgi:N-acetylmuramoyl-L-alanine amidase